MILSIISWLGVYCGVALALIAPEELRPGKKYFEILYFIIQSSIINLVLMQFMEIGYSIIISLIVGWLIKQFKWLYNLIPISFFFSQSQVLYGLVFLLGFPLGSIFSVDYEKKEKIPKKKILFVDLTKNYFFFLVVSLIVFLIK